MKNEHYVYALVDPINRITFYIGKGKKDRCYAHLKGYANYNINKFYKDKSLHKNEGSKNPNSKKIICNGITFGCMKDAYEYFNVSKQTFKKRYDFNFLANL